MIQVVQARSARLAAVAVFSLVLGVARAQDPAADDPLGELPALTLHYPPIAQVFDRFEIKISLPPELTVLGALPATQIHDVYDADRNGVFAQCRATFTHVDGEVMDLYGFAMRATPGGDWEWHVRWAPPRAGDWTGHIVIFGSAGADIVAASAELGPVEAMPVAGLGGFLQRPDPDNSPRALRQLEADGTEQPLWMFGAARAWVAGAAGQTGDDWYANEWLDVGPELLDPMREAGYNLLGCWMAPWEYLLVHHDPAEYWRQEDGSWARAPRPEDEPWTSYQSLDQGRALAFDAFLTKCEGNTQAPTVYLLLTPFPRQCVQTHHPWNPEVNGWRPEPEAPGPGLEQICGFSGFREDLGVWDFFAADPSQPLGDWRSQLFDHQANFFTYVIARWGYSRAVGAWSIIDELDSVGDVMGLLQQRKGWWGHPDCGRWLADMIRLFRGQLVRADGLPYLGDPWNRPIHAATSNAGGGDGEGGNLAWDGGPVDARPDVYGWHWYPWWRQDSDWRSVWAMVVDNVAAFGQARPDDAARLISEFGAIDRAAPDAPLSDAYPTLYHHALWAAFFSGHAATPLDWDDGKEFGELRWRERPGLFDLAHYPLDKRAAVAALRAFTADLEPRGLRPCADPDAPIVCQPAGDLRCCALYRRRQRTDEVYGWLYAPTGDMTCQVVGLRPGAYRLEWFDPWTGDTVPGVIAKRIEVSGQGVAALDASDVFMAVRTGLPAFPRETHEDRGRDLAFRLVPAAL